MERNISFGKHPQYFSHRNESKELENPKRKRNFAFNHDRNNNKKKKAEEFRYGNYHQYYGYRNKGQIDPRIQCMKQDWFRGKDVLDIGCNAGHFTLTLARDFSPRSIIGLDIDNELVKMSMRNVRHYVSPDDICEEDFPISLALSYGPVAQALDPKERFPNGNFPFNVQFVQGNYVLPSDNLVEEQEEYFDTVLCLSVTKWIHLNWGDEGIKRLFRRIFNHLHPGGNLILEAQAYHSYARKKKITEDVYRHYSKIQLFPEMFNEYLMKEVGFATCELIDVPSYSSQGFNRPLYLLTKSTGMGKQPKHVIYHYSSDSDCDVSDMEQLSD